MSKAKAKATIMVADGSGGLVQVVDHRFDPPRNWPIRFEVPKADAETWLRYFYAECHRREWSSGGIGQIDASENSGSISVNAGNPGKPQLNVVWERRRHGSMQIGARTAGQPQMPVADVLALFEDINECCRSRAMEKVYLRRTLEYDGLPWRGEFWLDATRRLGPPSLHYEGALFGPRAIVVDALVECIGRVDAGSVFDAQLRELAAFLSVVLGTNIRVTSNGRQAWSWKDGPADCAVRNPGYWQSECPTEMPARGASSPVPLRKVTRPDFDSPALNDQILGEKSLPSDIGDLWVSFRSLTRELRQQFLQAAAKWQQPTMALGDRDTLSVALMVVACEALKPVDGHFREHNIYHVVAALLGESHAKPLDLRWFRAQGIRSAHLHAGEFHGSEFLDAAVHSSFKDPTFDEARRVLWPITQGAIIDCSGAAGNSPWLPYRVTRRACADV